MKITTTKKIVASLMLSTALLPVISGNAAVTSASAPVTQSATSSTQTGATSAVIGSRTAQTSSSQTSASQNSTSQTSASQTSASSDSTSQQPASSGSESATSQTSASQPTSQSSATSSSSQAESASSQSATSQSSSQTQSSAAQPAKDDTSQLPPLKHDATLGPGYYGLNTFISPFSRSIGVDQQAFLNQIKAGAIAGWQKYRVLPSITAAQAILESGWGRSQLATLGNNLFGIKGSYMGQSISFPTQEWNGHQYVTVNAAFRRYPNWSASVEDHGAFLNQNSRYGNLLGKTDYREVANLLHQDGYATAPNYAQLLISIINSNNLHQWDQSVTTPAPAPAPGPTAPTPAPAPSGPNVTPASGRYTFSAQTAIHSAPDEKSAVVGTYGAGESVRYNGRVQIGSQTWLRYTSYSGATRYVLMNAAPVTKPTETKPTETKPTVTATSGVHRFTQTTAIKAAPDDGSATLGTYNAGETVYYNGRVTANGQTWLRYLSYSGRQHYVKIGGGAPSQPAPAPAPAPSVTATSGRYRFNRYTLIKNAPSANAATVGSYGAGESVYYNGKVNADGQTWLRYRSYSGATRYVAIGGASADSSNQGTNAGTVSGQRGSFRFSTTTHIRTAPSLRGGIVGRYFPGEVVYYNGTVQADGYTWLRYLSRSGATHYVAVIR
ncbi:glucosaminidase domain-containing protein [Lactiplantibacillus modestisalitolerans]|uniref:Glucosaminidase domain-containing protein n=1 Tax=Lactiplantibacillus modestisalitolerans TaxID=1457219 RepID=A0ABV5WWG2_9LACO|nr:glucosaminidase domain-containing protein [Lactiplantibacillus modestisalitolerans]